MAYTSAKRLVSLAYIMAWFFAVASALWVGFVSILCLAHPQELHCIMATSVNGTLTISWALTYQGWRGVLLALAEVMVVVWALLTSRARKTIWRFIGHFVLISWVGLWTVNAFRVFSDGTLGLIYILPIFLICTCIRAALDLSSLGPVARPESRIQKDSCNESI